MPQLLWRRQTRWAFNNSDGQATSVRTPLNSTVETTN
jgi:hypothetical protein